jgi:hypothetical protein
MKQSKRQTINGKRCRVAGCATIAVNSGMCSTHYQRWWRHGSPDIVKKSGRKMDIKRRDQRWKAARFVAAD